MQVKQKLEQSTKLIANGQRYKAMELLVELVCENSKQVRAWWLLAQTIPLNTRKPLLEKVLELKPDYQRARDMLAQITDANEDLSSKEEIRRARHYISRLDNTKAYYILIPAYCKNPRNKEIRQMLSSIIENQSAVDCLVPAQAPDAERENKDNAPEKGKSNNEGSSGGRNNPTMETIKRELERTETSSSNRTGGEQVTTTSATSNDPYTNLLEKGMEQQEAGNYNAAIETYSRAIRIDSQNPQAYALRASAYEELGDITNLNSDIARYVELGGELDRPITDFFTYYWPAFLWLGMAIFALLSWWSLASGFNEGFSSVGLFITVVGAIYLVAIGIMRGSVGCSGLLGTIIFTAILWPPIQLFMQGKFLVNRYFDWRKGLYYINLDTGKPLRRAFGNVQHVKTH